MTPGITKLVNRVDALSLRERVLCFASAAMLTVAVWHLLLMQPVYARQQAMLEEIRQADDRIGVAEASIAQQVLEIPGGGSAAAAIAARLEQVRRNSAKVEVELAGRARELIDPAQMARVLEDVLGGQRGLELVTMRNLGAEALLADDGGTLFRHGLQLEVEGPYLDCLRYLQALEALPWRLYWQMVDIEAEEYPQNRIRIEVSTLSFEEDWIGV